MGGRFAITGATLIDGGGGDPLERAVVVVEDAAIAGAGMSEMEALVAATRSGAEILQIERLTGTIEPGKAADLLVLAANPLADITKLARENMVLIMAGGQAVKNDL